MNGDELKSIRIPPHFAKQIQAIAYICAKDQQAVLNAVLAAALPDPHQAPENLLQLAFGLIQPGDSIPDLISRFKEVRDFEKLPFDDHALMLEMEVMTGVLSEDQASLLEDANHIFTTGKPIDPPSPERGELPDFDDIVRPCEGDEWKNQ